MKMKLKMFLNYKITSITYEVMLIPITCRVLIRNILKNVKEFILMWLEILNNLKKIFLIYLERDLLYSMYDGRIVLLTLIVLWRVSLIIYALILYITDQLIIIELNELVNLFDKILKGSLESFNDSGFLNMDPFGSSSGSGPLVPNGTGSSPSPGSSPGGPGGTDSNGIIPIDLEERERSRSENSNLRLRRRRSNGVLVNTNGDVARDFSPTLISSNNNMYANFNKLLFLHYPVFSSFRPNGHSTFVELGLHFHFYPVTGDYSNYNCVVTYPNGFIRIYNNLEDLSGFIIEHRTAITGCPNVLDQ